MSKKNTESTEVEYVAGNNAAAKSVTLAEYAADLEERAQALGLPVVSISHPDAKDGDVYTGKYAGIRLTKGDLGNTLSNGESL
jgi:hypothetical protein